MSCCRLVSLDALRPRFSVSVASCAAEVSFIRTAVLFFLRRRCISCSARHRLDATQMSGTMLTTVKHLLHRSPGPDILHHIGLADGRNGIRTERAFQT
ncbi:hypothetical protein D3C87_1789760 [compost metagenome]